jgi:hypothetical protein
LCCLIFIFALLVFSHPLTSFFTLLSVFILIIFRRCYPFWLPILMTAMAVTWMFIMAGPYLSEHVKTIFATFGELTANVPSSLTSGKFTSDPLYQVIAKMRLLMTALLWLFAFLGGMKRLRQGNRDITYILLAIAGFPFLAAPQYGREMLLRIYLFTEPFMVFFAASLFFDNSMVKTRKPAPTRATFPWRIAAIIAANLILLSGFFFTRYGDERVDYISKNELNAVQYLSQVAPPGAFIVEAWNDAPVDFEYYAKDDFESLSTLWPDAVIDINSNEIVQVIEGKHNPFSYIIFSQEEQVQATSYNGIPSDTLQRLERGLLETGRFKLIYSNSDAQILQFFG